MGAAVEEAVYKAIRALQDRDIDLARSVVAGDNTVDELENRVEEECLKILALHQPVAIDLRASRRRARHQCGLGKDGRFGGGYC